MLKTKQHKYEPQSLLVPLISFQIEEEKCTAINKEVSEKQASCEKDLAAAEPLVEQAEAALNTLNKKDLGEAKSLKKPPAGQSFPTEDVL